MAAAHEDLRAAAGDDVSRDKFEQHFRAVDVALAVAEASTALLERNPSNRVRDRAEAAWNRALLVIRDYRDYICYGDHDLQTETFHFHALDPFETRIQKLRPRLCTFGGLRRNWGGVREKWIDVADACNGTNRGD